LVRKNKNLVTVGAYQYTKHPFNSSLLFLALKVYFENPSWISGSLAVIASVILVLTAKVEAAKNIFFQYHLKNI